MNPIRSRHDLQNIGRSGIAGSLCQMKLFIVEVVDDINGGQSGISNKERASWGPFGNTKMAEFVVVGVGKYGVLAKWNFNSDSWKSKIDGFLCVSDIA